ncbi:hypothetical protein M885DRAFT_546527 [Pelagophyceae sp. CCMP2097]|nr:hypothetical protein M885DRAFT_546527 [Pelagophyceae sp. CCMP2097]
MVGLQLPSGETVDGVHPKSPCEAKAECRRRGPVACAAFVWSPAWSSAVFVRRTDAAALVSGASAGEGPQVLYVALSAGADSVARALAAFDAAPRFQRTSSASIVARQAQWAARGGGPPKFWDETVSHGWYAEAKHETTAFDVYAISHEAWVQQPTQKLLEIYDGPCAAKSKCASMPNCDGFAMRHRDGTALLYAKLQIRSPEDKATSRALERFASKFRRVTWLYVRVRSDGRRSTAVPTAPASLEGTPPPRYDGQVCFGSGAASGLAAAPPAFELERVGDAQLRLHELEADAALAPQVAARNRTRLIVSLTTLPGRIEQIRPVLETLLSQTLAPDEIIVAVPLKASRLGETRVPPWLAAMPRVRVLRPEMDFGPATKLVAALRESLDRAAAARLRGDLEGEVFELATRIVVVDDDTLYSPRLVESLAAWAARLPEAAVATTGWPVASGLRYPHWTQNYLVYGNELYAPHRVAVVRGNCGFLVRPSFFKPALWEDMAGAPRGAVLMDDVWISGMLTQISATASPTASRPTRQR